jgi:nucleoside-diphosphate-sugar epimerase
MSDLIFGCGYVGQHLAGHCAKGDSDLLGVVRTTASLEVVRRLGIEALQADLDQPSLPELPLQDATLFYFIPPPKLGETDTRVRRLISEFERQGHPQRVIYLSTTGVYGDCKGEWVSEERPANPEAARAKRRWDAENSFQNWRTNTGRELVILRVAGIYGPGKLPLERLRKGLPLVQKEESPWTNRIHIEDLVRACVAAGERGRDGEVYNVSDGSPGTMIDYFNLIAELAGLPPPPAISLAQANSELSEGMLSYMRESRRVDNSKLRRELGLSLIYPSMESGLPACFSK